MTFLGQLRLDDLPTGELGDLLPRSGLLTFFVRTGPSGGPEVSDSVASVTIRLLAADGLATCLPPPGLGAAALLAECSIAGSLLLALPDTPPDLDARAYRTMIREFERKQRLPKVRHRLLGYPDAVQVDPVGQAAGEAQRSGFAPEPEAGWQLLLQLDSDPDLGTTWGDAGRLYVAVPLADLRRKDFSRCWAVVQEY
jgi:hypothetical protein